MFRIFKPRKWDTSTCQSDLPNLWLAERSDDEQTNDYVRVLDCKVAIFPRLYAFGSTLLFKVGYRKLSKAARMTEFIMFPFNAPILFNITCWHRSSKPFQWLRTMSGTNTSFRPISANSNLTNTCCAMFLAILQLFRHMPHHQLIFCRGEECKGMMIP